jgi:hypothetical protein
MVQRVIFLFMESRCSMKGLIADESKKRDVLRMFIKRFVKSDFPFSNPATNGGKLIWCNFSSVCKIYSSRELFESPLAINSPVYFYDEFTEELFFTDFEDVRSFINGFEPWDEVDAEIFDESLEWVIAVTHEDVSLVSGLVVALEEYDYDKDMLQ